MPLTIVEELLAQDRQPWHVGEAAKERPDHRMPPILAVFEEAAKAGFVHPAGRSRRCRVQFQLRAELAALACRHGMAPDQVPGAGHQQRPARLRFVRRSKLGDQAHHEQAVLLRRA